jgi:hypothetical protein
MASPSCIFLPFQTISIGRSGLLNLTSSKDYAVKLTVSPQVLDRQLTQQRQLRKSISQLQLLVQNPRSTKRSKKFGMTLHFFIVITILTALSLSSPASFPLSAPTFNPHSPRIALWGSSNSNDTLLSYDLGALNNSPEFFLKGLAIIGTLIIILVAFLYCLVRSYLRSDDRKERKAAEEAEAGEDKGYEGGGKEDEGDGKADEGEGKVK